MRKSWAVFMWHTLYPVAIRPSLSHIPGFLTKKGFQEDSQGGWERMPPFFVGSFPGDQQVKYWDDGFAACGFNRDQGKVAGNCYFAFLPTGMPLLSELLFLKELSDKVCVSKIVSCGLFWFPLHKPGSRNQMGAWIPEVPSAIEMLSESSNQLLEIWVQKKRWPFMNNRFHFDWQIAESIKASSLS